MKATFIKKENTTVEDAGARKHYWYTRPDLVDTESLNFIRATVAPGEGHNFHTHPEMEEILYYLSGTAEQWVEKEKRIMHPGDAVHIPKGMVHATFNYGENELEFLAILTPANSPEPATVECGDQEPWASIRENGRLGSFHRLDEFLTG